jgi:hypothetical protein
MRNKSASARPICRARVAWACARHEIGGDRTKGDLDWRAHLKIVYQRNHQEYRPNADQRQRQPAQAHHADGVNDVERQKGRDNQDGDREARYRRRRMQQDQIERRDIPQPGKSAKVIIRALHPAIGEIKRARDGDANAEQRRRYRRQQAARADGVGRHENVCDKIDHEVEHFARPVRLHPCDVQPPRDRTIDRVDHQRGSEPPEHRGPVLAHGLQQRDQSDPRPQRREDVHGECGSPYRRRDSRCLLLVDLVHRPAGLSGIASICTPAIAAFGRVGAYTPQT